ncbi:O166 family O-antigen flippase, partial [Escherichia coli]|nr:O166 family O-antigen flippase [Escherichia coli]HBE7453153.1 O166 family O-antigen flippase [Escherichia coli]HEI2692306.1 O166 family O-antigen flippase [Escherichia coli]
SKRDLIENIKKITLILFLVVIFMQVFSYLFLPFIITLVFGHEYFNAGQIAVTLLPSLLFYAIDSILMQVLYKDKNAIAILFKWLSMMMISCSLYYVWYGLLSEMNMAMIFNINYVIMTAITFLFVKKGLKVRDYD